MFIPKIKCIRIAWFLQILFSTLEWALIWMCWLFFTIRTRDRGCWSICRPCCCLQLECLNKLRCTLDIVMGDHVVMPLQDCINCSFLELGQQLMDLAIAVAIFSFVHVRPYSIFGWIYKTVLSYVCHQDDSICSLRSQFTTLQLNYLLVFFEFYVVYSFVLQSPARRTLRS